MFTALTGAANPFNGIDVGYFSTADFVDIDGDGDGDLDLVSGGMSGAPVVFENTTPGGITLTVAVTPENDPVVATGLPADFAVVEDTVSDLDLSALMLFDPDNIDVLVVLTASAGTMAATDGDGVTVTNSGTGALGLTGTASAINAYLNIVTNVQYTGGTDVSGGDVATVTLTGYDGAGAISLGTVNVYILDALDVRNGTASNDLLVGTAGVDQMLGLAGNDVLQGSAGVDFLDGGSDTDVVDYRGSTAAVTVNLLAGVNSCGYAEGDILTSIEYVYGSNFEDVLTGDDQRNLLFGKDGDDTLSGGGGNDVIRGGTGADSLAGGDGIDWLHYVGSASGVTVDLTAIEGLQSASGGDADGDVISGFEFVRGSSFDDVLTGNDERNVLIGEGGNDTLSGGGGNYVIRGGSGADTLAGGTGADTFIFDADLEPGHVDTVSAFGDGGDIIRLQSDVFGGLATGTLDSDAFVANETGQAETASQLIIYDTLTGALFFDADGNGAGAALQFASLSAGLALSETDFFVF